MDRRNFLKASVAGLGSSFALGGLTVSFPRKAHAANIVIDIAVNEVIKSVSPFKDTLTWQYVNASQPGPGLLGSSIVVTEGDTVTINLQNNLTSNHSINLVVPGLLESSAATPIGAIQSYTFTASTVGSYLYYDDANGMLGRAMGLLGPLVVLPVDGSLALTPGGTSLNLYDREYTLVMHEIDSRINDAVNAGLAPDLTNYQPDFFFVNGLSYPETVYASEADAKLGIVDDTKVIYMQAGENVAIRLINGGLIYYPMHFHGYHVNVVNNNRVIEENVVEKDTVLTKVGETVEVILSVGNQLGLFPLHTHYIPAVTSMGVYAGSSSGGGNLLLMKAV